MGVCASSPQPGPARPVEARSVSLALGLRRPRRPPETPSRAASHVVRGPMPKKGTVFSAGFGERDLGRKIAGSPGAGPLPHARMGGALWRP